MACAVLRLAAVLLLLLLLIELGRLMGELGEFLLATQLDEESFLRGVLQMVQVEARG